MNKKLFVRLLCALLSVLTLVAIVPAMALSTAAEIEIDPADGYTNMTWTKGSYESAEEYLQDMGEPYYANNTYELYCDETVGVVVFRNKLTGEMMFTNPWNVTDGITGETAEKEESNKQNFVSGSTDEKKEMLSQVYLKYSTGGKTGWSYSYVDAAAKGQIVVVPIKNGVRVEYAMGPLSPRILAPERIEQSAFEEYIKKPLEEGLIAEYGKSNYSWYLKKFMSYYRLVDYVGEERDVKKEALARDYPVLAEKNVNMYMLGDDVLASETTKREIEAMIKKYCGYTLEMMDEDYDFLNYEREDNSPPLFKMALEYVIDEQGLSVTLPANGLRYDESMYKIEELYVLPYMGASLYTNGGYSFIADGSGSLFELDTFESKPIRVYGDDYALQDESDGGNITIMNHQVMRMPVYGQVEITYTDKYGNALTKAQYQALSTAEQALCKESKRGYLAIIEEGESLAKVELRQENTKDPNAPPTYRHSTIRTNFITRQKDKFDGGWSSYAARRYVENYTIRYVMLTDDTAAQKANLSSYYECSWLGMAFAYRDYLDNSSDGFNRLTATDISDSAIPLYIETFGCMDTIEKVLSMPVTVSKALTTFEDVATMYDYLCANGVKNVNFKLKGYANGGLYSDIPYDLDWESAVGGDSGFEELLEKAKKDGFGVYPDFDFVYTTQADGGSDVSMKSHASRSIFNQYTTKRAYSSTYQSFVSYYQMVMSPSTYAYFYEEFSEEYAEYAATGISLGSFGSAYNSDFDEEKISLREESKQYVMQGLAYFKNQNYDVMIDGGNAFTWSYVDHILNVPMDSSRYSTEMTAIPFMGVVLHGYKQFASTALNKEGNISYAMLKAMESGASIYFVLSYANTELLKEDEVLSQNYSVIYDTWQERLVEIYQELNSVLADVQTKLIVNHEVLNLDVKTNTVRVPDQDELLKDIEELAQSKKEQVEQKIEAERLAKLMAIRSGREAAQNAVTTITAGYASAKSAVEALIEQISDLDGALRSKWDSPKTDATNVAALETALKNNVIKHIVMVAEQMVIAENEILAAKAGYDFLKSQDVNEQLIEEAKANLEAAIEGYAQILTQFTGLSYTVDAEAWIEGTDNTISALEPMIVAGASVQDSLYAIFTDVKNQLVTDGYAIDLDAMLNAESAKMTASVPYTAIVIPPVVVEDTQDAVATNKYKVDNNVVAVTYGESKSDPYKTLLLNFNDYTIRTTYNGVTYTIAAYDYVEIKY